MAITNYQENGVQYKRIPPVVIAVGNVIKHPNNKYDTTANSNTNDRYSLLNCIDIDWDDVDLNGMSIKTTAELLNVISTLYATIDIILSVDPNAEQSYVYMGSLNNIMSLLYSEETEKESNFPIYHIDETVKDNPTPAVNALVNNGTIQKINTTNGLNVEKYVEISQSKQENNEYSKGECLCYFGPAKFLQKNNKTNKTCFKINDNFLSILYCTKKSHKHTSWGHLSDDHATEDDYIMIDGEKYVIAITQTPTCGGSYKFINLQ